MRALPVEMRLRIRAHFAQQKAKRAEELARSLEHEPTEEAS